MSESLNYLFDDNNIHKSSNYDLVVEVVVRRHLEQIRLFALANFACHQTCCAISREANDKEGVRVLSASCIISHVFLTVV